MFTQLLPYSYLALNPDQNSINAQNAVSSGLLLDRLVRR